MIKEFYPYNLNIKLTIITEKTLNLLPLKKFVFKVHCSLDKTYIKYCLINILKKNLKTINIIKGRKKFYKKVIITI